jgi:hypothetical protein
MKTNDYLLITATAAYSFLFYNQNAGINFLLFSLVLISILLIRNKALLKDLKWCGMALLVIFSSVCVVVQSSVLSIFANVISLLVLSGISFNSKTSALFNYGFTLYSIGTSFIFMIIDGVRRQENPAKTDAPKNYTWLGILIVSFVAILFFALYKHSNPLFAEYTSWVNFDFINFGWFVFTIFGFFLLYGYLYHRTIPVIETWENSQGNQLAPKPLDERKQKRLETEKISLIVLFTLLNIMLIAINIGDMNTILLNGALPKGIKHSDFVHEGVASLIFSIVFAISIIMFFLRGDLNFYKGNRFFKFLVLLWIFQNVLMLFSTAWRNDLYIHEFTLTDLRIGVYVWLVLAFIGLVLTAIKIVFNRSNFFLVRSNFAAWIIVLVFSSTIDWDRTITRYNLQNKKLEEIDYNYLFSLSETNIPEMINFCKDKIKTERVPLTKSMQGRKEIYNAPYDYLNLLNSKIEHYLRNYTSDIRSWDLRDKRILKAITNGKAI